MASAEELEATAKGQSSYTKIVAVGVAVVAILAFLVQSSNQDILDNKLVVGLLMGSLIIALVLATVSDIYSNKVASDEKKLKLNNAHASSMAREERASARELALIQSEKFNELFELVGTVKPGTKEAKLYMLKE